MRVRVRLHGFPEREREVDVPAGGRVQDVLSALGIRRDLVLVFRAERPVPDTDDVHDGETLRVLRIVSGGAAAGGPATASTEGSTDPSPPHGAW